MLKQPEGYLLDLQQFATDIAAQLLPVGNTMVMETPLGKAIFPSSGLIHVGKRWMIPIAVLAHKLGARMRFSESEFALMADLPWTPGESVTTAEHPAPIQPDILAPEASLSFWHSEAYFNHIAGQNSLNTFTDLGGALGQGFWRLRYYSAPGGQNSLQNYSWVLDHGDNRWLLGNNQLALDPLLPYAELTGVQYAWTNRPDILYENTSGYNEFVANQYLGGRTISGSNGPPGGIAELRINGRAVARTTVHLNGIWNFRNIVLRGDERVVIALYQRFGDGTPLRIEAVNVVSGARSLPAGAMLSYGGIGLNGNPLNPAIPTGGMGGFYEWRYGLNQRMTLGATVQRANGTGYGMLQSIFSLGDAGNWSIGIGRSSKALGWRIRGGKQHQNWYWRSYIVHRQSGYFPYLYNGLNINSPTDDRYLEVGRNFSTQWGASLIARSVHDPLTGNDIRFIKPAFWWQPDTHFSISGRPDYLGQYAYLASWSPTDHNQLQWSRYAGVSQVQFVQRLPNGLALALSSTHNNGLGTRYSALLNGTWARSQPVVWSVGLLEGQGHLGYLLDAAIQAIPGLTAHLQLMRDPLLASLTGNGLTFQFVLVADFTVTPSGLTSGTHGTSFARLGAIAGKVSGELPENVQWKDLADMQLLVDGKPRGRFDRSGRFLIEDLAPGVYQVRVDAKHLPIDLQPAAQHPWVQVRAGSTTSVNFKLLLRLGFAGQVTVAGKGDPDFPVEVLDSQGKTITQTITDTWGYYRIDGLPPGRYTVRAKGTQRTVTLTRQFLFEQNLALPAHTL